MATLALLPAAVGRLVPSGRWVAGRRTHLRVSAGALLAAPVLFLATGADLLDGRIVAGGRDRFALAAFGLLFAVFSLWCLWGFAARVHHQGQGAAQDPPGRGPGAPLVRDAELALYRRVIEIRDSYPVPRPYLAPGAELLPPPPPLVRGSAPHLGDRLGAGDGGVDARTGRGVRVLQGRTGHGGGRRTGPGFPGPGALWRGSPWVSRTFRGGSW
ncbi:DUF6545 domain-containing protein [Streptomyces sp. NPDC000594]|uniref:DUF6545 domain-containing protein n=1 Tax=Streptomyces sp. NPDC000594 TaxID=3154261 RepID=UPI00331B3114